METCVTMTKQENTGRSQNGSVAKGWLSTFNMLLGSCHPIHTQDRSWKKMEVKMMMMMMMMKVHV